MQRANFKGIITKTGNVGCLLQVKCRPQACYGKGPDYFLLKTVTFPISVFLLLFSMKFHPELENNQHDSFNKGDLYLSLFITTHAQNKQFL